MNKNVRYALFILLIGLGMFACEFLYELQVNDSSICFAAIGTLISLLAFGFWELVIDNKKNN